MSMEPENAAAKTWEKMAPRDRVETIGGDRFSWGYVDRDKNRSSRHHPELDDVLCSRCTSGTVFRRRDGQITAICNLKDADGGSISVPLDIEQCTGFYSRAQQGMTLEEMTRVATLIDKSEPDPAVARQYL